MIEEVDYSEIKPFQGLASKDHVALKPTLNTRWFAYKQNGRILGVGGLIDLGKGRARLKGAWVRVDRRGEGIGEALLNHRIEAAKAAGFAELESFSLHPGWFVRHGFVALAARNHGVHVVLTLTKEQPPVEKL